MRKKPASTDDTCRANKYINTYHVETRDGSPHYVFLYSDDEFADENIPLQLRKCDRKAQLPKKVEVINVVVKSDDTLQALALRYRCTISELKRINKIHKENEIFARNVIKVPVQPFSIFTELNEDSSSPQTNDIHNDGDNADVNPLSKIIPNIKSISDDGDTNINNLILNSMCEPLNSVDDDDDDENDNENETLLVNRDSSKDNQVINDLSCSGADWGLSWIHLLGISLFLGLLLPIIYIYYYTEHR